MQEMRRKSTTVQVVAMVVVFAMAMTSVFAVPVSGTENASANGKVKSTPEGIQYVVNGNEVTVTGLDWENDNKDVVIPSAIEGLPVTAIGENAQGSNWSGVETLTVPVSVKTVASDVFDGFDLDNVYYEGTIAQWRQISIGSGNNDLVNAFISYAGSKIDVEKHSMDYNEFGSGNLTGLVVNKKGVLYWLPKKKKIATGVREFVEAEHGCLYILKKSGQLWLIPYHQKWNDKGYKKKKLMSGVADLPEIKEAEQKEGLYVIKKNGQLWLAGKYKSVNKLSKPKRIMKGVKEVYYDAYEDTATKWNLDLSKQNIFVLKKDGSLWGFGNNKHGELGQGDTKARKKPVKILGDVAEFEIHHENGYMVSKGTPWGGTCYAIKKDGGLWAWGQNGDGLVGGEAPELVVKPARIMQDVVAIDSDNSRVSVLRKDGSLWAWGEQMGKASAVNVEDRNGDVYAYMVDEGVKCIWQTEHTVYYIKENDQLWYFGGGGNAEAFREMDEPKKLTSDVFYVHPSNGACYIVKKNRGLYGWYTPEPYYSKNYGKTPKKIMGGMAVK